MFTLKNKKTKLAYLLPLAILLSYNIALAVDTTSTNVLTEDSKTSEIDKSITSNENSVVKDEKLNSTVTVDDKSDSYKQYFTITAYYSPIEGQKKYIRGSLAADKKLNGNGTHGADGTPVYPGMVAAPKTYIFGTKMLIPGIGTVAVHDRGGAIISSLDGSRHDRLDIWMGYGDEGLERALKWGKRNVEVTVYGVTPNIIEKVEFTSFPANNGNPVLYASSTASYNKSLSLGDSHPQISEIKKKLNILNYFKGTLNNEFDSSLRKAVIEFQIATNIIKSENSYGAGYLGPITQQKINATTSNTTNVIKTAAADETDTETENNVLVATTMAFVNNDLSLGDTGQNVIDLQNELKKLNLFGIEPTGYYGELTQHAVYKFQQSQKIVNSKTDLGAGIFGPETRNKLSHIVNKRLTYNKLIAVRPEVTIQ